MPDVKYTARSITATITLDEQELQTLHLILRQVGGSPETTRRKHVTALLEKLEPVPFCPLDAESFIDRHPRPGALYFKDN